jgi:hypothetical protein
VVADIDGDGLPDVVMATSRNTQCPVGIRSAPAGLSDLPGRRVRGTPAVIATARRWKERVVGVMGPNAYVWDYEPPVRRGKVPPWPHSTTDARRTGLIGGGTTVDVPGPGTLETPLVAGLAPPVASVAHALRRISLGRSGRSRGRRAGSLRLRLTGPGSRTLASGPAQTGARTDWNLRTDDGDGSGPASTSCGSASHVHRIPQAGRECPDRNSGLTRCESGT